MDFYGKVFDEELTHELLWPRSTPEAKDLQRIAGAAVPVVAGATRAEALTSAEGTSAGCDTPASSQAAQAPALDAQAVRDAQAPAETSSESSASGMPSLAVNLGGIKMKNPLNTASGTFGYGWQFEKFIDVSQFGAITTKGCSSEPWKGNPAPRLCTIKGGIMNSVGLQNPGISGLIEGSGDYLSKLAASGTSVICQVAAHTVREYVEGVELFEELAPWAAGLELNVSCPNIAGGCALGSTPEGAAEVVKACRSRTKRPLLIKMAPVRIPEIARAIEDAGADVLSVVNSIPGMAIDIHTRKSKLSKPTGGMSGPGVHPAILKMVWEAHKASSLPINACGGVVDVEDAAEFILAGATAVSLGYANIADPWSGARILCGLSAWVKSQGVSDINELIGAFDE